MRGSRLFWGHVNRLFCRGREADINMEGKEMEEWRIQNYFVAGGGELKTILRARKIIFLAKGVEPKSFLGARKNCEKGEGGCRIFLECGVRG